MSAGTPRLSAIRTSAGAAIGICYWDETSAISGKGYAYSRTSRREKGAQPCTATTPIASMTWTMTITPAGTLKMTQTTRCDVHDPAEHNVGQLYPAKPALADHCRALDPTNGFSPGIGRTSKRAHWG